MFHPKDVLSHQLLGNANEKSWYAPFSESVKNLTEEEITNVSRASLYRKLSEGNK